MAREDRDSWVDVYMQMAFTVSKRSPDAQTQCGCVITTKNNRIVSCGYNGYPRDIDYSNLPDTRPDKYPWMFHAERNAVLNCPTQPKGCSAYVSCPPCRECLMEMWQAGIDTLYVADVEDVKMLQGDGEYVEWKKEFLALTKLKYIVATFMVDGHGKISWYLSQK